MSEQATTPTPAPKDEDLEPEITIVPRKPDGSQEGDLQENEETHGRPARSRW